MTDVQAICLTVVMVVALIGFFATCCFIAKHY